MPLDPSISLQAQVPQFQQQNPIQTLGSLAVMQNQLNQARLFQQTFAAKMQMGQMIASSPDLDTAFNNITKSGLVGYAPELALMVKQMHQAEVGIAGEQQKQVGTALEGAQKYTAMAFNNPAMMPQVQKMALDSLPANAPPAARAALNDYFTAITSGVQPGMTPQQATGTFQSNAIGAMTSAGIPAPTQQMVTGETGLAPLGGSLQPYYRAPIGAGGGLTPTGPGLPMTLAPKTVPAPGGGEILVGGAAGAPPMGMGAAGAAPSLGITPPPAAPSPVPAVPTAGDGTPLYTSNSLTKVPLQPVIGGMAPISEALKLQNDTLQKEYGENGQKELTNSRLTQGSVSEIKGAFNNLMRGSIDPKTGQPQSNFLDVGSGGQFRADIGNLLNTTAGIIGMPSIVDPGKLASAQDLMKATNRLGVQYTVQMLGGQREAASTIERLTSGAQPNLGNTYLGGMLVANMVNAGSERAADWRRYQGAVMAQNNGFLSNQATSDFDQQHPYSAYVSRAFDNYKSDVANAFKNNYITKEEAASALRTVLTSQAALQQGQ